MARAVASLAALVLVASSCRDPAPRPPRVDPVARGAARPLCSVSGAPEQRAACDKQWAVLVYMAADAPGLTPFALWNLHQMEGRLPDPAASAASGPDADVVVELDVDQPPGIRRLRVVGGLAPFAPLGSVDAAAAAAPRSPVVETLDEAAAEAPPATPRSSLTDFLSWAIAHYPARHYAVIVWGHGFGFRPATGEPCCDAQSPRGGIALDLSRHAVLDIPALREALADASAARLGGRPFDLYLSDACLMQTIEVASELAGVARYIGGAEAKLDPLGLPYRLILPRVNGSAPAPPPSPRCPARDPACRLAVMLPDLVRRGVAPDSELYATADVAATARDNLTYSLLDARALAERAVPAMHQLGAALLDYLREAPYQDERKLALRDLLTPHRPSAPRPFVYAFIGGGRDIGSLLFALRAQLASARGAARATPAAAALADAIDRAEAALRSAVLASALGSRYDDPAYAGMLGVSAWLPISADDYAANAGWFAAAAFYLAPDGSAGTASPWGAWLNELFGATPAARWSSRRSWSPPAAAAGAGHPRWW